MKKTVKYTSSNSYCTLNTLSPKTKNIWFVFHGIGYLSKYFIKYFKGLDPDENYVVAPQAPSKYYLKNEYKYVGASWLTKEDTKTETVNVLNYVDAVFEAEKIPDNLNLILFGFSQGVSIVTRWAASRKIKCEGLFLYAGKIPEELSKSDFDHLMRNECLVKIVYGDSDIFLNEEQLAKEKAKMEVLFGGTAQVIPFKGGHEVKPEIIKRLYP